MIEATTIKWFLATAWRNPVAWIVVVLASFAWPLFASLFSLGVTTSTKPPSSALLEIGVLAGTVGATMATFALAQGSWWLHRTTPWRRFRLEFTGLATGAFVLTALTWVLPVLASSGGDSLHASTLLTATLLTSLRLAAFGVCILAIPVGPLYRAAMLPLMVFALPNLLQGTGVFAGGIRFCFELVSISQFSLAAESPGLRLATYLAPILGLCLLRMAAAIRRATHPCGTQS